MIELRNVNKTFNSEGVTVDAAKNINLKIEDGEIFGIIGYSGAGKSTLKTQQPYKNRKKETSRGIVKTC